MSALSLLLPEADIGVLRPGWFQLLGLSPERNDLAGLWSGAIEGPCFHQLPPLVEQIAAPISRFGYPTTIPQ